MTYLIKFFSWAFVFWMFTLRAYCYGWPCTFLLLGLTLAASSRGYIRWRGRRYVWRGPLALRK